MNSLNLHNKLAEQDIDTGTSSSPATMLTTICLLIPGLLLTSTLLLENAQIIDISNIASERKLFSNFSTLIKTPLKSATEKELFETKKGQSSSTSSKESLFSSHKTQNLKWPKLRLIGFGSSSDTTGNFAIINGRQVHLGQSIDGKVRLIEIRKHDVLVEFKGESRILTMD